MEDGFLKQAKVKAARYCSFRERAPSQVLDKLLDWDIPEEKAEEILQELIQENFVNEERFCKAFCHDKFEFNRWGKRRIELELKQHDLPAHIIKEGLSHINLERYRSTLRHLAENKWSSLASESLLIKRKNKTVAYLMRKGFEGDLVWDVVQGLSVKKQ